MSKILLKVMLGMFAGAMLFSASPPASSIVLCALWGVGVVYGFRAYLTWLSGAMNTALKLSVIAWLSFGTGLLGFLLLLIVLMFVLTVGWLYGWYLLIKDVIAAL